jgi:hypothetical protein
VKSAQRNLNFYTNINILHFLASSLNIPKLNMRSCWTLTTSGSVLQMLTWPPSWRYRVCFIWWDASRSVTSLLPLRKIITAGIRDTMMYWIDGLECINRCWTEWGYFRFKMAFIPCIDIIVIPSEGMFFKRHVNYQKLSALFSSGFQRCIFMRIRFLIFFLISTIRKTSPCSPSVEFPSITLVLYVKFYFSNSIPRAVTSLN